MNHCRILYLFKIKYHTETDIPINYYVHTEVHMIKHNVILHLKYEYKNKYKITQIQNQLKKVSKFYKLIYFFTNVNDPNNILRQR